MNDLVKQIIQDVCYIGVTTIFGVASFYFKKFIDSHKDLIEKQQEALKQQIGDAQYNKDVEIAKMMIYKVEELAKEYNWESTIKHSKATEFISAKTDLSSGDIYDIIKSTIGELNKNKQAIVEK